jgi:cardiolipin synthase
MEKYSVKKLKRKTMIPGDKDRAEEIELVYGGNDYFTRLLNLIRNAHSEIHFQTYIFEHDSTGIEIVEALIDAAARGVKVYLLLDAYGSGKLSKALIAKLNQNGVQLRFFSSFFSFNNIYLGRRMHHKVVVADGSAALIGGINIANKYRGSATQTAWLDYAVQIHHNVIARQLQRLCRVIYFKKHKANRKRKSSFHHVGDGLIRILENDWLFRKNQISQAYITAIQNAKREIIIVGSYYLPGHKFTSVLKQAARRGVQIKLILAGVSDLPIVKRATQYLYDSLLHQKIELYEWDKSVLHGKVALVDDEWATVGSFNLNHLSSYGSIEMNVEIKSTHFSEVLKNELTNVISKCEKITPTTMKTRRGTIAEQIVNWISYRLVRTALNIITYLPYKRFYQNLLK